MDAFELIRQARLVRTKRKTLCIQIRDDGLIIKAPLKISNRRIQEFLMDQKPWVTRQLMKHEQQKQQQILIHDGCHFPFMGTTLKLQAHEGLSESCIENDVLFLKLKPGDQPSQLKPAFENWLKQEARRYIPAFAEQKAQQLGISDKIASFRFSKTKSKWGSCSPDGKLQFNWLIMLSPLEVIHYLVCHEVCHLLQMNHSPAFWQLLGSIHPDYKTSKSWLKQNGHRLWID